MEESTLATATADVMIYDDDTKRWIAPDGRAEPARSHVRILQNVHTNAFRIVGTRLQDRQWILNCNVYERMKYNPATSTFHQWRDERRKVHGLSFVDEGEARNFINLMSQALSLLSSSNDYPNGGDYGLSNGVYHEPQQLHHNAHSAPSFRDNDQESICSAGIPVACTPNYRKSSHSVQSSAGLMLSNAQQRRASQGSSSSSSNGSSGPTTIYASSSSTCATNSPSRAAPSAPGAVPPAPLSSGPPPAPPLPPGGIAALSTNAPPAPPPPPAGSLTAGKAAGNSIADQIKNVHLRKTNASTAPTANGTVKSDSLNGTGGRGMGNLVSELEATLNKRKMFCESVDSKSDTTAATNGSLRRPWEKPSGATHNGTSTTTESPKTHRKAPSGSSLSSQEESKQLSCPMTNGALSLSNGISVEQQMEKLKLEILNEFRAELNKAKAEIIEAIRCEIQRR